jgi:formylglycine-generating enzyme
MERSNKKGNKVRKIGRWLRSWSFLNGRSYSFIFLFPFGLMIIIGYYSFNYLTRPQKTAVSQAGTFYGVRIPDKGYLFPEMVKISSGSFAMGSEEGEADEKPVHKVSISAFEIGRFEVTNAQWKAYCDAEKKSYPPNPKIGPDYFLDNPNHPVLNISWDEAQEYCQWLSKVADRQYRLPTEAEWEYAAQGSKIGCFSNNQPKKDPSTTIVGNFEPNSFGLYDMLGNVWEWCEDWYDPNFFKKSFNDDPTGPENGKARVLRGGSWGDPEVLCRVSNRIRFGPKNYYRFYGLRVAATLPTQASIVKHNRF